MLKDPRIDLRINGFWYFNEVKYQTYKSTKAAADAIDAFEGTTGTTPPVVPVEVPDAAVFELKDAEGYRDGWYYLQGEAYVGPWASESSATTAAKYKYQPLLSVPAQVKALQDGQNERTGAAAYTMRQSGQGGE